MYSRNLLNEDTGSTSQGKGGRYETKTKKTRGKADICRSDGGSYGAVGSGCERLGRDECEGGGGYGGNHSSIFDDRLNKNY